MRSVNSTVSSRPSGSKSNGIGVAKQRFNGLTLLLALALIALVGTFAWSV